jgi:hypothetical protein
MHKLTGYMVMIWDKFMVGRWYILAVANSVPSCTSTYPESGSLYLPTREEVPMVWQYGGTYQSVQVGTWTRLCW